MGAPGGATGAPGGATGAPGGAADAPGGATGAPGGATGAPGGATGAPGGATGAPGGAADAPGGATGAPGGATGAPGGATGAPGGISGGNVGIKDGGKGSANTIIVTSSEGRRDSGTIVKLDKICAAPKWKNNTKKIIFHQTNSKYYTKTTELIKQKNQHRPDNIATKYNFIPITLLLLF